MRLGKNVKIILILFLFVIVMIPSFSFVFGALNDDYVPPEGTTISSEDVNTNFIAEKITEFLGKLIFYFGQVLEWILSIVAFIFTGKSIFPWADMIIYNAVPMLDVNFINPSSGSLIASLQGVIQNLYFTILSIAIAFFGMAVLTMSVRLITTAIASEKAKYKQAIMNWVMGLTLLFTIHYFIAFIFFLNENMVKLASTIATENIADKFEMDPTTSNEIIANLKEFCKESSSRGYLQILFSSGLFNLKPSIDAKKDGEELLNTMEEDPNMEKTIFKMLQDNASFRAGLFTYTGEGWSYFIKNGGIFSFIPSLIEGGLNTLFYNDGMGETVVAINDFTKVVKSDTEKLENEDFWINKFKKGKLTDDELKAEVNKYNENLKSAFKNNFNYIGFQQANIGAVSTVSFNVNKESVSQYSSYVEYYYNLNENNSVDGGGSDVIASLADYFKYSTMQCEQNAIIATKMRPENAIMYVILIAQSVLYFFAYIKRFFYVIILALMAPIVVAYDFFNKSIA